VGEKPQRGGGKRRQYADVTNASPYSITGSGGVVLESEKFAIKKGSKQEKGGVLSKTFPAYKNKNATKPGGGEASALAWVHD